MTYDEIAKRLFNGTICPTDCKHLALELFDEASEAATKKWKPYAKAILVDSEYLINHANKIVDSNKYAPCLRAGFFAALFSPKKFGLVTNVVQTMPHPFSLDCRLGTRSTAAGMCLRSRTGVCGDRYDNCLSIHAAQWLTVPEGYRENSRVPPLSSGG